jgi:hypothetical protein
MNYNHHNMFLTGGGKMNIPEIAPIVPIPGRYLPEMAETLDISESLLYLLVRKAHTPSTYTKRRITKNTGLPASIWELPRHETITRICQALRGETTAEWDPQSLEDLF